MGGGDNFKVTNNGWQTTHNKLHFKPNNSAWLHYTSLFTTFFSVYHKSVLPHVVPYICIWKFFFKIKWALAQEPIWETRSQKNADAVRAWHEDQLVAKDVINQNYTMEKRMQPSSCRKEMWYGKGEELAQSSQHKVYLQQYKVPHPWLQSEQSLSWNLKTVHSTCWSVLHTTVTHLNLF